MGFSAKVVALQLALAVALAASAGSAVVINEAQSSNGDTLTDRLGENSDWIELYNGGDEATFELTVPERAASLFIQVLPMED